MYFLAQAFQVFASQWWNLPARNTLEPLLALYTDPETLRPWTYRQTDGQTDGRHDDASGRSYCVVDGEWAKNRQNKSKYQYKYKTRRRFAEFLQIRLAIVPLCHRRTHAGAFSDINDAFRMAPLNCFWWHSPKAPLVRLWIMQRFCHPLASCYVISENFYIINYLTQLESWERHRTSSIICDGRQQS